jgi:hypothetical protein
MTSGDSRTIQTIEESIKCGANRTPHPASSIEEYFAIKWGRASLTPPGKSDKISVALHLQWCNGLSIIQKA